MRKALAGVAVAGSLAVFLASCGFGLQAFSLLAGSLEPGDKTIARFALRPLTEEKEKLHQFVLVGVPTDGDVTVGKATWGTNGKFAGPLKMPVSPDLASTLVAEGTCGSSGLQFEDITGMKWKGFTTPKKIADRGLVGQKATTDVVVRAKSTATEDGNFAVVGVTGVWIDDGDGEVGSEDSYFCSGIATTALYVNAA